MGVGGVPASSLRAAWRRQHLGRRRRDEIRRTRSGTAPWHYVTIPHDAAGLDAASDGCKGENVIGAAERQAKVLADKARPRPDSQSSAQDDMRATAARA